MQDLDQSLLNKGQEGKTRELKWARPKNGNPSFPSTESSKLCLRQLGGGEMMIRVEKSINGACDI